jgi:hypothetical protein
LEWNIYWARYEENEGIKIKGGVRMKALGVCLIILGIVLGLWLGIWFLFIGGIIQFINAIKASPVNAMGIALGLLRVVCASPVGWISFVLVTGIGCGMVSEY